MVNVWMLLFSCQYILYPSLASFLDLYLYSQINTGTKQVNGNEPITIQRDQWGRGDSNSSH